MTHLTPFLMLVLAGYAAFMITLASVWGQNYAATRRETKR